MDITPIQFQIFKSVNTEVGDYNQAHTCRNIGRLREWVAARHSENIAISTEVPQEKNIPTQGYVLNDDANLPWRSAYYEEEPD